jgi:hypothetical protein
LFQKGTKSTQSNKNSWKNQKVSTIITKLENETINNNS